MKMVPFFLNSEYIDVVLVYDEPCGSALQLREFPCDFLWGYTKDLVYSIPIDTIEVLRERMENAATTIRNNRGMLERVYESFRRRLHYYCIDNNGGHFNTSYNV
jgi:hypothetical protein